MRPNSAISTLPRCLLAFMLLAALALAPTAAVSAHVAAPAVAAAAPASAASAGCQWTYYPIQGNALQPPQALYNDPDNTPIADLSVGRQPV